jgi:hypothetical protein
MMLARSDHHADGGNGWMAGERLDRAPEHRLPAELPLLLGHAGAGAFAFSGSDDEGGSSHSRGALGALAL